MANSLSGLHSMDYLLSNHNMMIGVNTINTGGGDEPGGGEPGGGGYEQDVYDIRHLVRQKKIIVGESPYDETVDLNCDAVIDNADLILMKKLLLGAIPITDLPIYENFSIVE